MKLLCSGKDFTTDRFLFVQQGLLTLSANKFDY